MNKNTKQQNSQTGFTIVYTLIIVTIIAVVLSVGWYVWHQNNQNYFENTNSSTDTSSANKSVSSTPAGDGNNTIEPNSTDRQTPYYSIVIPDGFVVDDSLAHLETKIIKDSNNKYSLSIAVRDDEGGKGYEGIKRYITFNASVDDSGKITIVKDFDDTSEYLPLEGGQQMAKSGYAIVTHFVYENKYYSMVMLGNNSADADKALEYYQQIVSSMQIL